MSDTSANPSCESPASRTGSPAPIPVPPPAVDIEVDENVEYRVSSPIEIPEAILPRSALALLQAYSPNGNRGELQGIAQAASRSLLNQTATFRHIMEDQRDEITRLRRRLGGVPLPERPASCPRNFFLNIGRPP